MIPFTKMQGLGNDYVYIDGYSRSIEIKDYSKLARKISDRHFGVGSDGLILILKSKIADFKMRMFNYDGSEAEMCGNGIRCVGKFVYDKKLTKKEELTIETLAGIKKLKLNIKEGLVDTVEVDMGEPILEPKKIPVIWNKEIAKDMLISAADQSFLFTCVSMGNPHAITRVSNIEKLEIEKYGPILEVEKHFPKKANIEFIEILNENTIKMRVWERGAKETLACGTGACASVVACNLNHWTKEHVKVQLLGGQLDIVWDQENNHVYMTGPARSVFEGEYIEE